MPMQNFIVLTSAQRDAARALNNEDVAINPRAIDNAAQGIGLNINPDATGVAPGAVMTLAGNFVAPKRIVDDPQYVTCVPGMVALLLTLPWAMLESESIFAPVSEI